MNFAIISFLFCVLASAAGHVASWTQYSSVEKSDDAFPAQEKTKKQKKHKTGKDGGQKQLE